MAPSSTTSAPAPRRRLRLSTPTCSSAPSHRITRHAVIAPRTNSKRTLILSRAIAATAAAAAATPSASAPASSAAVTSLPRAPVIIDSDTDTDAETETEMRWERRMGDGARRLWVEQLYRFEEQA